MASSIFFACVLACLAASFAQASDFVDLWTFDGKKSSTFGWKLVNDPVMGGLSNSTFKVNKTSMTAVWDGEVRIVPSLDAPGFCNVETSDWPATFNDASSYDALVIKARAFNDYTGYKVSFAANTLNPQFSSFKAPFNLTGDGEWHHVTLPWTDFSDDWSSFTGDCFTKDPSGKQHVCCTPDTPDVCPTQKNLKHITQIGLWTEGGIPGKFNFEVEWVRAYKTKTVDPPTVPPTVGDFVCKEPVQDRLRYNVSYRTDSTGLITQLARGEDLATGICCDSEFIPYAEPNGFYARPDVALFSQMDHKGITHFYDTVCGIEVFKAPVGRSFQDFKKDTNEHGWPSFRSEEVHKKHVVVDEKTGAVTSSCGTHLGSFLPDDMGDRYCIDLVCISGNQNQ